MSKTASADNRRSLLTVLTVLGLIAVFAFLPSLLTRSSAGNNGNSEHQPEIKGTTLEDYDIRNDNSQAETLLNFRQAAGRSAVENADVRDKFVRGEEQLRRSVPTLKIEYNNELDNPEVIAPDVLKGYAVLTAPSSTKRSVVLSNFAKQNNDLLALTDNQIENLKVAADYSNPNGELSFARMEQTINGIPVYRAEIRAGFNKQGAMFRVVNNLAPGLDYNGLSTDFGSAEVAVRRAAGYINHNLNESETTRNGAASTDLKVVFGQGDWATTAEKMYFPVEVGVARTAWRVLIWEPVNAYYVIVDAETGTMLSRENITKDQTEPATFNVYANTTSLLKTMANPAPLSPNPISPLLGTQGVLMPRSNVTLIGNEAPYTFNNNGWINNGANTTDGNAVEAGIDRVTPNGVDAAVVGTNRVFNFTYTPGAGANNGPGDSPLLPAYQNGAATNLFYVSNRYHDETYLLGFTEQARNFQHDNFGRGGLGNDRVSAEAQDSSGVNNANFATPADGSRGRMQMFLWDRM
ncbi:MAG TPA: M36 family metallopeptidase, partial [Pyrinomonadaceae bacterium]|nr:M36 family metallopeptidase [Pyrinomonadaceae bacterium]